MTNRTYIYSFRTKSGQKILVRPLEPDDTSLLVDVFDHMSPESRYRRFHQTLDHVSTSRIWQEAENITQADPDRSRGLLALAELMGERTVPVGAVRFVETTPCEADVAISIRDDFQNQGIGTQLMFLMADEAQFLGYHRLVAGIQNDNPAIWQVFNKLPYKVTRLPVGSYSDIVITLNHN